MKYLVFTSKISLEATSDNTDLIEGIEIEGGLWVVPESVYLENKTIIDSLTFVIRNIEDSEWKT